MFSRVRRVSVAALAALTVASACPAAESSHGTGRGGIGGQIGFSSFRIDRAFGNGWFGDYSAGANPRFSFSAHWRYAMSSSLRWQVSPGLTWSAYGRHQPAPMTDPNFPDNRLKNQYLTLVLPVSAQLQYVVHRGGWVYYGGVGPGVYRVWIENNRKVLKDPLTLQLHRGLYPGGSFGFGVERFLKVLPTTSLEASLGGHLVWAQRPAQFESGFNSNLMALELRVGGNYYFKPGDRKKSSTILPKAP
jgi:hypothetical protein